MVYDKIDLVYTLGDLFGHMITANLLALFTKYFVDKKFRFPDRPNLLRSVPSPIAGTGYMLYIHIPFCENLCPFCTFFRVPFQQDLANSYFDMLKLEIAMYKEKGANFETVYFGGGTPTVLPERLVELIEYLKGQFPIKEISVETNPKDLTPEILVQLKKAGVNRLSVGVQTFDDEILDRSNRLQKYGSGTEIQARLKKAAGIFDTLNIDLIFNFPGQTETMLRKDLEMIRGSGVDQITFYPLMTSPAASSILLSIYGEIEYKNEEFLYAVICEELRRNYKQESVWCFSRQQSMIDEYVIENPEYIGVGAGALSFINNKVFGNSFSIPQYLEQLKQGELPVSGYQNFSSLDRYNYELIFKLFGKSFVLSEFEKKFSGMTRMMGRVELIGFFLMGIIKFRDGKVMLTEKGCYCLLAMMREMLSGLNNFRAAALKKLETGS